MLKAIFLIEQFSKESAQYFLVSEAMDLNIKSDETHFLIEKFIGIDRALAISIEKSNNDQIQSTIQNFDNDNWELVKVSASGSRIDH